ncbi:MAG: PepSY domain-containing protein [Rhodobacteraceae bacterium]|nr:PepSY domain-containing protein [Paracoccaceae bacterium]
MKPATKARLLKFFRVTHSWLGLLVFPWILVIGLTGLYLNHSKLVLGWISSGEYDESQFAEWPTGLDLTMGEAIVPTRDIWPGQRVLDVKEDTYHGFDSFIFKKDSGRIIVTRDTGHYFVRTNLTRTTYAPDGTKLHRKIYWNSAFNWLHARGWLDNTFGTWLADIAAGSMVIFALSGLYLFFAPRMRKIRRNLAKLKPARKLDKPEPLGQKN